MGYFSEAWKEAARDRWAEAPHLLLDVRPLGSTESVVTMTDLESIISMSTIKVEREREFGILQGQTWQVELTNNTLVALNMKLVGGWAMIKVGFPVADVWNTLAVGKIVAAPATTGGVITLDVEDQLVTLANATLKRDMRFQLDAWASEIKTTVKSDSSKDYDMDASGAGVEATGGIYINDETFVIEFTSSTEFNVILEDGTGGGSGNISTDVSVENMQYGALFPVLKIHMEGWETEAGSYATGDSFIFHSSKPRPATERGAIALIRHLIEDIADIKVLDFDTNTLISPVFDSDHWDELATETELDEFAGTFEAGTNIMDMIQGITPVVHAAPYPQPDGTIACWMLEPAQSSAMVLNGDPALGDMSIISGSSNPTLEEVFNRVRFNYKSLFDGSDAFCEEIDEDSPFEDDRPLIIDLGWEVRGVSVQSGVSRALRRFKVVPEQYQMQTTYDGATAEIGNTVALNEPTLGLSNKQVSVVKVENDSLHDTAVVGGVVEEITLQEPGIVGDDTTDPVGTQIGAEGDPGAGRIW